MDKLAPTEIRYPYAIVRACSDLPYLPAFSEMPDGFIRVVLKIIQKINLQKPFSEIFASRQTLAVEAGKSLDTVHRSIQWLEQHNLIERERKANIGLRGSRSPLVPTKALLMELSLVDERGAPLETKKPLAKNPELHAKPKEVKEPGDYTRVGTVSLPTDLVWLCGKGLTPFAVLALMRLATKASQRLSHVVQSATKYLQKLRSNQLYAYLKTLLNSGRDFSAAYREEEKKEEEIREKSYILEKSEIYEGRRFISRRSGKVYLVESGLIRETIDGHSRVSSFNRAFIDAIEEGKLVFHP